MSSSFEENRFKISEMDEDEQFKFLKSHPGIILNESDILVLVETPNKFYSEIIYMISENNKVFNFESYRKSYLFENYYNFNEEEIYYLCEAMKLQIIRGYDDPYIILHHFLKNILESEVLQRFLITLTSRSLLSVERRFGIDYKIREFFITSNLLRDISKTNTISDIFKAKLITNLIDCDNYAFLEYINDHIITFSILKCKGCLKYFEPISLNKDKKSLKENK